MDKELILDLPSKMIAFAREVYPDEPAKVVKVFIELAINQEITINGVYFSEDEIIRQTFPRASDRFISRISTWFVRNDVEFLKLIKSYGLTNLQYTYASTDYNLDFKYGNYMVINYKG